MYEKVYTISVQNNTTPLEFLEMINIFFLTENTQHNFTSTLAENET